MASPRPEMVDLLMTMPFLGSFEREELRTLASVLVQRTYLPKQIVFRERDRGNTCYFVVEGEIVSCKAIFGAAKKEVLSYYRRGSIFGFISLLDQKPRSSPCFARLPSTLLELNSDNFDLLFNSRSRFAFKFQEAVCKILVTQVKQANANLAYFSDRPKNKRKVKDAFDAIIGTSKLVEELGVNLEDIEVLVPEGIKYRANR